MASSSSSSRPLLLCLAALALMLPNNNAEGVVHRHEFVVQETPVKMLCKTHRIVTVNAGGQGGRHPRGRRRQPGAVRRHHPWHGVRQLRSPWADGPELVTQCPIRPGERYKYRFSIEGQEGTLWWHAHSSWLRATVYGALIIRPRSPFHRNKPPREHTLILGEWWNANPMDVIREAQRTGGAPSVSDAFTINGQPGDFYKCSHKETTAIPVKPGDTALLRFINAALNHELFVGIACHRMTVVAVDASYTKPFTTDVLMLAPGQTTDVLVTTMDQAPTKRYYLVARAYHSSQGVPFNTTTAAAVIEYDCGYATTDDFGPKTIQPPPALFPVFPAFNDTAAAAAFAAGIKSPEAVEIHEHADEHLFFSLAVGLFDCEPGELCAGPNNNTRFTSSINNVSFVFPRKDSLLHAHYSKVPGVFTTHFRRCSSTTRRRTSAASCGSRSRRPSCTRSGTAPWCAWSCVHQHPRAGGPPYPHPRPRLPRPRGRLWQLRPREGRREAQPRGPA